MSFHFLLQLSPTPMVQADPKPDKTSSNTSTKFQEVQRKWMTTSPTPQHPFESDSDDPHENIYKKTQSKSVTSGANSVKNLTNRYPTEQKYLVLVLSFIYSQII